MILLTTSPITKKVTQKDILLSQIQNGGVQDDDTDDEEDELQIDDNQVHKGGQDMMPLGKPIAHKKYIPPVFGHSPIRRDSPLPLSLQ